MTNSLILFVAIIYLVIGINLVYNLKIGLGVAFMAYAIANVGLYFSAIGV